MKGCVLNACFLVLCMAVVSDAIICEDPTPYAGDWVLAMDGKSCVTLLKEKCGRDMNEHSTRYWLAGKNVAEGCNNGNPLPQYTAIATFLGGKGYRGQAAIFESCDPDGIWVYNQWLQAPVMRRLIPFHNTNKPSYSAENFFEITLRADY